MGPDLKRSCLAHNAPAGAYVFVAGVAARRAVRVAIDGATKSAVCTSALAGSRAMARVIVPAAWRHANKTYTQHGYGQEQEKQQHETTNDNKYHKNHQSFS